MPHLALLLAASSSSHLEDPLAPIRLLSGCAAVKKQHREQKTSSPFFPDLQVRRCDPTGQRAPPLRCHVRLLRSKAPRPDPSSAFPQLVTKATRLGTGSAGCCMRRGRTMKQKQQSKKGREIALIAASSVWSFPHGYCCGYGCCYSPCYRHYHYYDDHAADDDDARRCYPFCCCCCRRCCFCCCSCSLAGTWSKQGPVLPVRASFCCQFGTSHPA